MITRSLDAWLEFMSACLTGLDNRLKRHAKQTDSRTDSSTGLESERGSRGIFKIGLVLLTNKEYFTNVVSNLVLSNEMRQNQGEGELMLHTNGLTNIREIENSV